MSRSGDELSDDGSDDGLDRTSLLLSRCKPCVVNVDRLNQETISFWLNGGQSSVSSQGKKLSLTGKGGKTALNSDLNNASGAYGADGDTGDEEEEEGDDEEEKVETIDIASVDIDKIKQNHNRPSRRPSSSTPIGGKKYNEKIFCLFNLEEFDDRYEAVQAFYRELRYAPFRCWECDEATLEIKDMIDHFINHHPETKVVKYKIEEIPAKEKWVNKFINYQIQCYNGEDEMLPSDTVNKYCPVCNQFDYILSRIETKTHFKVCNQLDKNHINKHLKYNPYECMLCRKKGRRYAITIINAKARDHLANRHNIIHPNESHLKTYFLPTATIPELENFLRDYIGIIRENEKNNHKPQLARRKPIPGKSNKSYGKKGKQTGQLYKAATVSYKKLKESRDSIKNGKKSFSKITAINEEPNDIEMDEIELARDESTQFFCIFCSEKNLPDIYVAWGHYGNHLKYMPIVCQICGKKFTSDTTFRYHGIEHVEYSDLPFSRNCDEIIESWGHDFLEGLSSNFEAKPEFSPFCPVCEKIFSKPVDIPHQNVNTVKSHVYSHLKYYPFECLKCRGRPEGCTYVADLDYQAAAHLNSVHQLTVVPSELSKYFIRSRGIEALDKLLKDHFEKIQYLVGGSLISSITNNSHVNLGQTPVPITNSAESLELNDVENLLHSLEETLGTSTLNNLLNNANDNNTNVPTSETSTLTSLSPPASASASSSV